MKPIATVWGRNSRQPGRIKVVRETFTKAEAFGDCHVPVPLTLLEAELRLIC